MSKTLQSNTFKRELNQSINPEFHNSGLYFDGRALSFEPANKGKQDGLVKTEQQKDGGNEVVSQTIDIDDEPEQDLTEEARISSTYYNRSSAKKEGNDDLEAIEDRGYATIEIDLEKVYQNIAQNEINHQSYEQMPKYRYKRQLREGDQF